MKLKIGLVLTCLLIVSAISSQQRSVDDFSPYVDAAGDIRRPASYRENWAHLGTYFVLGDPQGTPTMHSVYTEKRYIDSYNQNGTWPDGAVIVKEVMTAAADQLTTGAANWAVDPVVWFVIVKDAKQRFPGNPLWGDGWGWALFEADAPDVQAAANYQNDCLNCHLPARETDLVFVQGYPSLHNESERPSMMSGRPMMAAAEPVDLAMGSPDRGAVVFAQVCAICHSLESDRVKVGPSLAPIAAENKLPSGPDASPDSILRQINNGGHGMPAFAMHLDPQQKADVISYIRSAR